MLLKIKYTCVFKKNLGFSLDVCIMVILCSFKFWQDGSWSLEKLYVVNLSVNEVLSMLHKAGAKSLGTACVHFTNLKVVVSFKMLIFVYVGSTVYKVLSHLVSTLLILKILSVQLPAKFGAVVFEPKLHIISESQIDSKYLSALKKALDFVTSHDKKYPSFYSRLELGFSWENALENILQNCCK